MILYKYLSHASALKMIENSTVGFRQPNYFNDPFELSASYPVPNSGNPSTDVFHNLRINAEQDIAEQKSGILSLTRQPMNPLMWAHYAENHTGMVVGIDSSIVEFTCENTNLIPVQYGSVIYTNTKPTNQYLSDPNQTFLVQNGYHFQKEKLELLQRMYLYKQSCWGYEEEVRVVKRIPNEDHHDQPQTGTLTMIRDQNDIPLYLMKLPPGAIKEIYLGVRNEHARRELFNGLKNVIRGYQPNAVVYRCYLKSNTWEIMHKIDDNEIW
jgi:hypothetical protein